MGSHSNFREFSVMLITIVLTTAISRAAEITTKIGKAVKSLVNITKPLDFDL